MQGAVRFEEFRLPPAEVYRERPVLGIARISRASRFQETLANPARGTSHSVLVASRALLGFMSSYSFSISASERPVAFAITSMLSCIPDKIFAVSRAF